MNGWVRIFIILYPWWEKAPAPQLDSVEVFFYEATIQSTYSRLRRGYRVTVLSRLTGIKIGVSRLGLKSCDEISRIKPLRRRCRKSIIVRCLNNNVGLFSFFSEQHLDLKVLAAKTFCNTDERKVFSLRFSLRERGCSTSIQYMHQEQKLVRSWVWFSLCGRLLSSLFFFRPYTNRIGLVQTF